MPEFPADLLALYERHLRVAGEQALQLIADVAGRASDISRREVRWLSASRWAKLVREGLGAIPEPGRSSVAVCLVAMACAGGRHFGIHQFGPADPYGGGMYLEAVAKARPSFDLQDLRVLLALDSPRLAAPRVEAWGGAGPVTPT